HNAEYHPYFIKRNYPELIERYNIPLDEYLRRCVNQINGWKEMREKLFASESIGHSRSKEYASYIMEAMETNQPFKIGGNVMNTGLITNLPKEACVEVPCLVDAFGLLTVEAAVTGKKEHIYHAAMLDPHTSAELSIDDIVALCDDLIEAHGSWLPEFK
ncbi:hypothetical protein BGX30_002963, partial [Mortierella sp. GBA39]